MKRLLRHVATLRRAAREWATLTAGEHLRALRRYRWLVVALAVLGATGAGVVSLVQQPIYSARVQLLVSPNLPAANAAQLSAASNYVLQRVRSYRKIVTSPEVVSAVIERLDLPYRPERLAANITVASEADTAVLTVDVVDRSPTRARDIANALGAELPGFIARLETPAGADRSPVKVTVVRPAVRPREPASPRTRMNVALGLVVGLALGAGVAVARYAADPTVRSGHHAARTAGAPLLGTVPARIVGSRPLAAAAAFRDIRVNLRLRSAPDGLTGVMVTAAEPGQSRTAVAANLAVALALDGEIVLLVDGDLRGPALARVLGIPEGPGLTGALRGDVAVTEAVVRWHPDLPLYVLPAGDAGAPIGGPSGDPTGGPAADPTAGPAEGQDRRARLAEALAELRTADTVLVVDGPPLGDPDALPFAGAAGAVVVVARVGVTPTERLAAAMELPRAADVRVLGLVAVE